MGETYVPKNILITGAAGFIASHVANLLLRKYPEYKIVVLDKLDYCSNLKNLLPALKTSKNLKFVQGDIASSDLVNPPADHGGNRHHHALRRRNSRRQNVRQQLRVHHQQHLRDACMCFWRPVR